MDAGAGARRAGKVESVPDTSTSAPTLVPALDVPGRSADPQVVRLAALLDTLRDETVESAATCTRTRLRAHRAHDARGRGAPAPRGAVAAPPARLGARVRHRPVTAASGAAPGRAARRVSTGCRSRTRAACRGRRGTAASRTRAAATCTTAVLGAGLALAGSPPRATTGVRLVFQPLRKVQPGGAIDVISAGGLDGVAQVFGIHCDPKVDVGQVGTRIGPITSASRSPWSPARAGTTSRPHLCRRPRVRARSGHHAGPGDPGAPARPALGVNLTWGEVHAGTAHSLPASGTVRGAALPRRARVGEGVGRVPPRGRAGRRPLGLEAEVRHHRGVPPVENEEARSTGCWRRPRGDVLGPDAVLLTEQSLGGEVAWYLTKVPGAMAQLGTRTPEQADYDIHQGDLRVERARGRGQCAAAGQGRAARGTGLTPQVAGQASDVRVARLSGEMPRPSPGRTFQLE